MKEYKDSEEIKRQLRIWIQECEDWLEQKEADCFRDCIDLLDEAPAADVVEVVRCKDCKHFTEGMAVGMCKRISDKPIIPMPYTNYCGFGERRNNHEM